MSESFETPDTPDTPTDSFETPNTHADPESPNPIATVAESESIETQCLRFLHNPINFSNSDATMYDLLGQNKILCLVTVPTKGDDGLYKGKEIPRIHKDWRIIVERDRYDRVTNVSYKNKINGSMQNEMPLDTVDPFDYEPPIVYYAFYALHPTEHEKMYELIGHGKDLAQPTCLPFPEKMNNEPYNPEQFPECKKYRSNINPTLVQFSEFLGENPNVQFMYFTYDNSEEMQKRRKMRNSQLEQIHDDGEKERKRSGRYYDGHPYGGGRVPEEFVKPTLTLADTYSPMKGYKLVSDSTNVLNRYFLDKDGLAFVGKLMEFVEFFFGESYLQLVKRKRQEIFDKMLDKYKEDSKISIDYHQVPNWLNVMLRRKQIDVNGLNAYLDGTRTVSNIMHPFDSRALEKFKKETQTHRNALVSGYTLNKKIDEFNKKAELQIPSELHQQNTGLANFMKYVKSRIDGTQNSVLNSGICCLFFSSEFEQTLQHAMPSFLINKFEIFRESNENNTNLLIAMKIIIDSIQPPPVTDGGNIKKLYSRKNRKLYSRKNRKLYSRKNRKSYIRKNRKSYIRKNI
jgi:hypothetical protein